MPTGHASVYLCPQCRGITAALDNRPRGFHETAIPIDPWGIPGDPMPDVFCPRCDVKYIQFDLHGKYLCLNEHCSIVVCPGLEGRPPCNVITARKDVPLTTTLCGPCQQIASKRTAGVFYCYYDHQPIDDDDALPGEPGPHIQYILSRDMKNVYGVDSCRKHRLKRVIYDNGFLERIDIEQRDISLDPFADVPIRIPHSSKRARRFISDKDRYRAHQGNG
jgi:hypothetical protein